VKALDILWLLLLIGGAYSGFKRGLIAEAFSLGAFLIATISSVKLMELLTRLLQKWGVDLGIVAPYIIFVLAFIAIVIIVTLIGKLVSNLLHMTLLGGLDKLLGAVLGVLKWAFFIGVFLWLANALQLHLPHSYLADTYFLPLVQSLAPRFLDWLSTYFSSLQGWLAPADKHTPLTI
jgi:membrane protein required for colicin V production